MKLYSKELKTPVGKLKIVASDEGLVAILWEEEKSGRVKLSELTDCPKHPLIVSTETQLNEYFAKKRTSFDLPLSPLGTSFQKKVWSQLRKIPFGETISYGELARRMGNPKSSRAVGAANGKNPLSIVVPCHRVIGADGKLTGFAGGMEAKEILLCHEGRKMM